MSSSPGIRHGTIRAQGPFAHSILAGTVGAVCLPAMVGVCQFHRKRGLMGVMACVAMVFASGSSGPIMSMIAGVGALVMWHYRSYMRALRWIAILIYVALDLVMKAPAYYLMARIDISGGSNGWHRARLIEMAIAHLHEWWLGGTDYTRHWMPTGVSWSPNHTDITNYYIKMGVIGGLPLMILLIALFAKGFSYVGQIIQRNNIHLPTRYKFMVWCLGASLFAHAATCISVSYFDQSFLFLYLTLAAIGSAWSTTVKTENRQGIVDPKNDSAI
ncbi:MAG: O-antigen ligase family protein [Deltaproteobacteria bacterium]|nr:O-antigen ligase family protein [Deltaproteobacteria bacterium]